MFDSFLFVYSRFSQSLMNSLFIFKSISWWSSADDTCVLSSAVCIIYRSSAIDVLWCLSDKWWWFSNLDWFLLINIMQKATQCMPKNIQLPLNFMMWEVLFKAINFSLLKICQSIALLKSWYLKKSCLCVLWFLNKSLYKLPLAFQEEDKDKFIL